MADDEERKRVSSFWFDRPPMEWIIAPPGLDGQLKSEFGHLVQQASSGKLDARMHSAEGSTALVALLDQFSRNIFRGSPDAFRNDAKAYEVATKSIAKGYDQQVGVTKATAFYMSLMHHENLISSIAASCLFQRLQPKCVGEEESKWVGMGIAAAERHMSQLERFGRYPTRNALLGRKNTEAEGEFLRDHKPSL